MHLPRYQRPDAGASLTAEQLEACWTALQRRQRLIVLLADLDARQQRYLAELALVETELREAGVDLSRLTAPSHRPETRNLERR